MSIQAQIERITTNVNSQRILIDQILLALQNKASGGGTGTDNTTAALDSAVLGEMVLM